MSENPTPEAPAAENPTPEAPAQSDAPAADKAQDKDWQAEAEKWKSFARKHEDAAKANADKAKRFDEFEESQKSEQQKLADKLAAAEARATELEAGKLRAEVAAEKGIPASLLSGSTLEELTASADALLTFRGEKSKPDFGGGDRGADVTAKKSQLTEADANRMTPDQIVEARAAGQFDDLLSGS